MLEHYIKIPDFAAVPIPSASLHLWHSASHRCTSQPLLSPPTPPRTTGRDASPSTRSWERPTSVNGLTGVSVLSASRCGSRGGRTVSRTGPGEGLGCGDQKAGQWSPCMEKNRKQWPLVRDMLIGESSVPLRGGRVKQKSGSPKSHTPRCAAGGSTAS